MKKIELGGDTLNHFKAKKSDNKQFFFYFFFYWKMGNDISSNYTDIKPLFTIGYWDVKKAKHKQTGQKVSLWSFDYPKIKAKERNTNERHQFMENLMVSIKAAQKINHPNVLKIYQYTDSMKQLAFSAEPVKFQIANKPEITKDEAIYASKQLANVMRYLNDELHFAYLSICPETIVFNKSFTLKLALFPFTRLCKDPNLPLEKVIPWEANTLHQMAAYAPPEIVHHMPITMRADTFMYGLFIYYLFTNENMLSATDSSTYRLEEINQKIGNIPEEYADLIKPCLSDAANIRPSFTIINGDEAFSSTVCDVFGYLDTINTKNQKEIFDFLTGLSDIVHVFSSRIKEYYFLPILKNLVLKDFRFGIIVIPIILIICEVMTKEKISKKIMAPLAPVFQKPNNPQLVKIILQNSEFVLNNITPNQLSTYIYPSIFYALNSNNEEITLLAIEKVKLVADQLSGQELQTAVIPEIIKALPNSKDPKIATIILSSIESFIVKTDHDTLIQQLVPAVAALWKKNLWPSLAEEFFNILKELSVKHESLLKFTVPLASEILANKSLDQSIQKHYFDYCINAFLVVMKDRGIATSISSPEISDALSNSYVKEVTVNKEDPFAARTKKKHTEQKQTDAPTNNGFSFPAESPQNTTNSAFGSNTGSDIFSSKKQAEPKQSIDGFQFADSPTSTTSSQQPPQQSGGFEFPSQNTPSSTASFGFPASSPKKETNNDFSFPAQQNKPDTTGFNFPSNTQQNSSQNQNQDSGFGFPRPLQASSSAHNLFSNQQNSQDDQSSGLGLSRPMRPSTSAHNLFAQEPAQNEPEQKQPFDPFSKPAQSNTGSSNAFTGFGSQQQQQQKQDSGFSGFGSKKQQNQDSGFSGFGSQQPKQDSGFSGFGNQQQQKQDSGFSGFGSQQPKQDSGFSGFGSQKQQNQDSGFGGFGSQQQQNQSSNAFSGFGGGGQQQQQQPKQDSGFSGFGASTNSPQQNRNSGSFGGFDAQPRQQSNDFDPFGGQSQQQNRNSGSFEFNQQQNPPQQSPVASDPFSFGSSQQNQQQQPQQTQPQQQQQQQNNPPPIADPFSGFSFE